MLSLQFPIPTLQSRLINAYKSNLVYSIHFHGLRSGRTPSVFLSKYGVLSPTSAVDAIVEEVEDELADARFPVDEEALPAGLRRECMPKHVAVIMDGNVRWARERGSPPSIGHEAGVRALSGLVERCCKWGIRVLTVFAFSSDNWNRPKVEVEFLMGLFERQIKAELDSFMREDIRVSAIGDSSKLPLPLHNLITDAVETTKHNSRFHLIVAVSYSGQYDIVQACQSIAQRVKDGLIQPEDINESLIEQELETKCTEFPYPDMLIRTSGELRVSNFLLWQMAYTELFFVNTLWPDFGEAEFVEALQSFQLRQRRFGGRGSVANGHEICKNR